MLQVRVAAALVLCSLARSIEFVLDTCPDGPRIDPALPGKFGWVDPRLGGGRMLDGVYAWRIGEPLNVIISGLSDEEVLSESGFIQYARMIGFNDECLGFHMGTAHEANLGDGLGWRPQQLLVRQTSRKIIPLWGSTCWESLAGGNHFRAWRQNGSIANSGAWFLAVSQEMSSRQQHMIVPDGWNVGRDLMVEQAISLSKKGDWVTDVAWVEGLLQPGAEGINHGIPQDGLIAVLTITRRPPRSAWRSIWAFLRFLLPFLPA